MSLSPVERTLYAEMLAAVCEDMGAVLQRSAYSPNIKERRDFSCALFDADGAMVAQGHNIPVHLGSMPASVAAALAAGRLDPGDVVLLNDPYSGGTHLPDLTVVAPVYPNARGAAPVAYVANRAHHADIGGMSGGSLPLGTELYQEGLIIPPVKVVRRGRLVGDVLALLLANTRTPEERRGDLLAQLAALKRGQTRMTEVVAELPDTGPGLTDIFAGLYRAGTDATAELIAGLPAIEGRAELAVELPEVGEATLRATVRRADGRLIFDLRQCDLQHAGPFNAVRSITLSAVFYVLRCLLPPETPTTSGLLAPVDVLTTPGTIADALRPCAVAAGNVETSQRLVELLLAALRGLLPERVPAAGQGTMNNLIVGGAGFTYYETLAGGHGAHPDGPGMSARHSHMTNSLNTPVEALEHAYPLRVRRYALRRGSGGAGRHNGGDGLVREVEFLSSAEVTVLAQSRMRGPSGALGGGIGAPGRNLLRRANLDAEELPGSCTVRVRAGDRLVIETPGGGGWGTPTGG